MPGKKNKGVSDKDSGSETEGMHKSAHLKTKPQKNYDKMSKGGVSCSASEQASSSSDGVDTEVEVNPVSTETVSSETESNPESSASSQDGGPVELSDNEGGQDEGSGDETELSVQLAAYKQNAAKMEVLELESQKRVKNLEKILLEQKSVSKKTKMSHSKTYELKKEIAKLDAEINKKAQEVERLQEYEDSLTSIIGEGL